jgi:hypothetical protein
MLMVIKARFVSVDTDQVRLVILLQTLHPMGCHIATVAYYLQGWCSRSCESVSLRGRVECVGIADEVVPRAASVQGCYQ